MRHTDVTIRNKKYLKYDIYPEKQKRWMVHAPDKEYAVAFCHSAKHRGYLDENMLKKHKCLEKQCPMLSRYEDRAYWIKRKIRNELKKLHKNGNGYICIDGKKYTIDDVDRLYLICKRIKKEEERIPEIRYQEPDVKTL